mmetsp:Transcript_18001/g.32875  ORF Transcript_18001/g.32875 Transcript_18001/m.32875 type:complete len:141 (-) Transcript_18001:490-912(-)
MRIAEGDEPDVVDETDARVAALEQLHEGAAGLKDKLLLIASRIATSGLKATLVRTVDLVGKHVQEDLRVALGAKMAIEERAAAVKEATELVGVGQIAVVDEKDAERGVHKERLSLLSGRRPSSRIANMSNANVTKHGVHN